jgi:hypothetical protein
MVIRNHRKEVIPVYNFEKKAIRRMKSSIMDRCIKEGINDSGSISAIVVEALKTINKSALAGHKAAITKCQTLACE